MQLVYVGALHPTDGVDCLVEAMPKIVAQVPGTKLIIVGDGIEATKLKARTREMNLEKNIQFLGTIGNPSEVERILLSSAIGIVPYRQDKLSLKYYNDPSKPRLYLGCSLPVIITDVPEVAEEIDRRRAGICIEWSSSALAEAAVSLLKDKHLLAEYRSNSLVMAQDFTWDRIFDSVFYQMNEG